MRLSLQKGSALVLVGNDVVAVEDGPRPVTRDLHGDSLGNPRANHVPNRRPPEIVEELSRYPGLPARRRPRLAEIAYRLPRLWNTSRASRVEPFDSSTWRGKALLDEGPQLTVERENATASVLQGRSW